MTMTALFRPLVALVVDDHESSRYLVASMLARAGFEVVEAATGEEAINLVRTTSIDLAVLDVNLADMSGFELCETIRTYPPTALIPVVHVSATAVDTDHKAEGLMRGADAYLVEPIEQQELLATITALVRQANARERAVRTASRLRSLNAASADVHGASTAMRVLESLIAGASNVADAPTVVLTIGDSGAHRWEIKDDQLVRDEVDAEHVRRVVSATPTGQAIVPIDDPALVERAHVGVCFSDARGEPIGAIAVPADLDSLHDEVLPLLAQLSLTATLALANLEALHVEHRIAVTLQRSFLPQSPPLLDDVTIAFRYEAASPQAQVGGDFYEAFSNSNDTVTLAIGDVVGHSLAAATVMGEVRHAIRAYAIDGYDPSDILQRIERLIVQFHPMMLTTAIVGRLDVSHRIFTFCVAGHIPLLVLRTDGSCAFWPATGPLLGLGIGGSWESVTIPLEPGDRVIMVTDGLVEVRGESIDEGLERLRASASAAHGYALPELIDRLVAEVGPGDSADDDIAIVGFELNIPDRER